MFVARRWTLSEYVFDQAWHQERERQLTLEALHDEATTHRLATLGVSAGWRCLEVGCGAGSIARWLADRVGASGHVTAIDLEPRYFVGDPSANLELRRHDLMADVLEDAAFDLIHARAVLEHIPAREQALARLVAATRPGGWVVIEDTYFGGAMAAAVAACTTPDGYADVDTRTYVSVATLFGARGARADYGPQLPAALRAAGLVNVEAELHARFTWGGAARDFRRLSLEQLRGPIRQFDLLTEEEVTRALDLTRREDAAYIPLPMVTAWGQRPV
jgi:SAM-dependent methyltransferase